MEEDVPLDPVDVGLLGATAVVSGADGLADPVEKSRWRDGGRTGFTDGEPVRDDTQGRDAISHCSCVAKISRRSERRNAYPTGDTLPGSSVRIARRDKLDL